MKPACPQCFAALEYQEHGGLFSIRCSSCQWHIEGTASRELFPPVDLAPPLVARAAAPIPAATLKVLRDEITEASSMPLPELRERLTGSGYWLGNLPKYKADELRVKLASVGAWLEELPHEEG